MKKFQFYKSLVLSSLIIASFTSCVSTNVSNNTQVEEEVTEKVVKKEPKPIAVKNKANQLETDFIEKLKDIELKVVSSPRQIYKTKEFTSAYVVMAQNQEGPVQDLKITVSYPISRKDNTIVYDLKEFTTDEKGSISFKPEGVQNFAAQDVVTFYPTPVTNSSTVVQASYDVAVTSPWLVKSDYTWYSGLLYVYDFNENNRPTTNSFYLLQDLRNAGLNVGNAPLSNTSYFDKPLTDLYNDTKEIVGNSQKFMVYGSLKFQKPVEQTDSGYSCTLVADISCIEMKTGSVFYKFQLTETALEKNKYDSVDKCKSRLAEKVANALIYGM